MGEGRLAALGHIPDCLYLSPLLRSPFSQAPQHTAQDAELWLNYMEVTLEHWSFLLHAAPASFLIR